MPVTTSNRLSAAGVAGADRAGQAAAAGTAARGATPMRAVSEASVASAARTSGRRRMMSAGRIELGKRRAVSGSAGSGRAAPAPGPALRRPGSRSHWRSRRDCFRAAGSTPRSARAGCAPARHRGSRPGRPGCASGDLEVLLLDPQSIARDRELLRGRARRDHLRGDLTRQISRRKSASEKPAAS